MGSIMDFVHNRQEWTDGPLTMDEMMKLLSILSDPAGADNVRKALRFYVAPEIEKPGPLADLLPSMKTYVCPYSKAQLDTLLEHSKASKAVLVVGAGVGGVLQKMVSVMGKGSLLVAVEGKDSGVPEYMNPIASLKETCRQLSVLGAKVELFIGDRKSKQLIGAVDGYAPFDFAFVNGDAQDIENYSPMARVMGRVGGSGIEVVYRE